MTWMRIIGWFIFAAGCAISFYGSQTGQFSLLEWGAGIGGVGIITTYVINAVRAVRRARTLPPGMRRKWDVGTSGDKSEKL